MTEPTTMERVTNWAGRGFDGLAALARGCPASLPELQARRRIRKIEVARLPLWGEAQPGWALGIPRGRHAVVHFYGPGGQYLHTSVVRDGGITMMWEGAKYWRAEPVPVSFDEVLAGIR